MAPSTQLVHTRVVCMSVIFNNMSHCNMISVYDRDHFGNVRKERHSVFFSFAYTTSSAAVMKLVVFLRSSNPWYNFWWSGVADGHCAIRSGWCLLHIWRTCSVVWSSSPQGHVGQGTMFSFLCMCALSLLWPERSRAKTAIITRQSHSVESMSQSTFNKNKTTLCKLFYI